MMPIPTLGQEAHSLNIMGGSGYNQVRNMLSPVSEGSKKESQARTSAAKKDEWWGTQAWMTLCFACTAQEDLAHGSINSWISAHNDASPHVHFLFSLRSHCISNFRTFWKKLLRIQRTMPPQTTCPFSNKGCKIAAVSLKKGCNREHKCAGEVEKDAYQ